MKTLLISILQTFSRTREFIYLFRKRKTLRERKEMKFLSMILSGQGFMIDNYCAMDAQKFKDSLANVIKYLRKDGLGRHLNIIDVGANLGLFTVAFSQFENVDVFAYEPFPESFAYLKENVERNQLKNVAIYNYGLFDENITKSIGSPKLDAHRNRLTRLLKYFDKEETGCKSMYHSTDVESINVQCKRADECRELNTLDSIDIVKIDVEGAELNVLRGFEDLLKRHKPVLRVEFNPVSFKSSGIDPGDIIRFLLAIGYTHVAIDHNAPDWINRVQQLNSYVYPNKGYDLVFLSL
ncbi:MAG: FkbM family methyltransferase [bacterium]|nr:FkbM family methyltransferase [bacterium]